MISQDKSKILVIGWFQFPFGDASGSRVRTIAKGLIENGYHVHVLTRARINFRAEDQISVENSKFTWQGIEYESVNLYQKSNKLVLSLHERLWNHICAIFKSWVKTIKLIHKEKFNIILIYNPRSFLACLPLILISKLFSASLFFDVVEWFPRDTFKSPLGLLSFYDDWLGRHLPVLGRFCMLLKCQGVIVISSYIKEKYSGFNIPCLIVPSILDKTVSHCPSLTKLKTEPNQFKVTYAGSCKPGDGFSNLLKAIKIVANKYCYITLDVLGTSGESGYSANYRRLCDQDDVLASSVKFLGRVSDEEYFELLASSQCLVLPRENSQISKAAFPTRLPEFLATGCPVLTTNVPDIPKYLTANVHAEIVPDDTPEAIAAGLVKLLENPVYASRVGLQGQEQGNRVFDYREHSNKLANFIKLNIV